MFKRTTVTVVLTILGMLILIVGISAIARQDQDTNSNQNSGGGNSNAGGGGMSGNMNSGGRRHGQSTAGATNSPDSRFMMTAAMGGMAEVEAGRIAAQRGSSDAVKQFGQRMVDDHTTANNELMQIASSKGVTLPTDVDGKHKSETAKLSQLSGAQFDRAYVKNSGVKDHEKTVKLFQDEVNKGRDPEVKAFAQKNLPIIQEHLRMARDMESGMTGAKGTNRTGNMNGNMNSNSNSQ